MAEAPDPKADTSITGKIHHVSTYTSYVHAFIFLAILHIYIATLVMGVMS